MGKFGIGQALRRTEDPRLLTGQGRYTDDLNLPGQAYGIVVRSPVAHGDIFSIDTEQARAMPGVLDIVTAEDTQAAGLGRIPSLVPVTQPDGSQNATPPHDILAQGRVRYVGQPLAFVVAETLALAKDAAEAVIVDIAERPANVDLDRAGDDGTPLVWDEVPGNRCMLYEIGDRQGVEDAFEQAAHRVTLRLVNNRIVVNPIEPRAALGSFADGRYTLYTPTQGVHSMRRQLAQNIFNVGLEDIRVVTGDVGGGFGMKIFLFPEQPLTLFTSKRIGRPVKWVSERSGDAFLADYHGRDHLSEAELALDADLRFTGLRVRTKANLGACLSNFATFIPTACSAPMLSGVYAVPAIHATVEGMFTNTVPIDAYRGAGRPEAAYLVERLVDKAAADLDVNAIELRRRNFIRSDAMPYDTKLGPVYDAGQFDQLLDRALDTADLEGFAKRRTDSAARGRERGLGVAYYIEMCGAGPGETADLRVGDNGHVTLYIGTQSNGQGHETAYAQLVADRLGIDITDITVVQGDSDTVRVGFGTGGSRSLPEGGTATTDAAIAVIEKGRRIAASMLETAAGDIDYADGIFTVVGTDRRVGLAEVARAARDPAHLEDGMEPCLDATVHFQGTGKTYPNGCHVAEVEIDRDTGETRVVGYVVTDDFGTVINPLLLAGQVHGGIGQGLGQAMLERTVFDPDTGQLLSGSFMDYCMPRADDMPDIRFDYVEGIPTTSNTLGVKGAGEAGAIGAPPAIVNAICNALKEYGVRHIDMPVTREAVWRAMRGGRSPIGKDV